MDGPSHWTKFVEYVVACGLLKDQTLQVQDILAETKFELKSQSLKPTALLAVITEETLFFRFVLKVLLWYHHRD